MLALVGVVGSRVGKVQRMFDQGSTIELRLVQSRKANNRVWGLGVWGQGLSGFRVCCLRKSRLKTP